MRERVNCKGFMIKFTQFAQNTNKIILNNAKIQIPRKLEHANINAFTVYFLETVRSDSWLQYHKYPKGKP